MDTNNFVQCRWLSSDVVDFCAPTEPPPANLPIEDRIHRHDGFSIPDLPVGFDFSWRALTWHGQREYLLIQRSAARKAALTT
jgi:hypothetical protein